MLRVMKEVNVAGRGFTFHLDMKDEFSQRVIFETGRWEPPVTTLLLENLKPGMIFVDVGASIGWFTVIAASIVGGSGCVIAFEPTPQRFRMLVENVKLNTAGNVECVDKAVSSENCEAYISGEDYPMYLSPSKSSFKTNIPIEAVTLDSYLKRRGIENVDMVKIDVEGAELRVLHGMEQTIRNSSHIKIICEIHIPQLSRYGDSVDQLFEYTQRMGLKRHKVTGGKKACTPRYLFYKEEKK